MRALAVALALALAGSAVAADPPDYPKMKAEWEAASKGKKSPYDAPERIKAGYFGKIGQGRDFPYFRFIVQRIPDAKHAVLTLGPLTFLAELDTTGLADGQQVKADKFIHCFGTAKVGTRTLLAIRFID